MANFQNLRDIIMRSVYENGFNEISGDRMQQVLLAMVDELGAGYTFKGTALPETDPGTPDYNVFYIAAPGTYPNFGGGFDVPAGRMGILEYNGSWSLYTVEVLPAQIGTNQIADAAITEAKLASALITKLLNTGYKLAGVATPSTNPGTPGQNVFYLAAPGSYTHIGSSTFTVNDGYIGVIKWDGSSWSLDQIRVGDVDTVKYIAQTLNDTQMRQARTNIGAASDKSVGWLDNGRNIMSLSFTDNYVISISNGVLRQTEYANYKATEGYYDCREQSLLLLRIRFAGGVGMAFYDENNNFISSYAPEQSESQLTDHVIPVPARAKYFRVSGYFPNIAVTDIVCQLVSFGNGIYDMLMGENYRVNGEITYNADHVASSFPVIWADGTPGRYTGIQDWWIDRYKMYVSYEVTYGDSLKVVQPPLTMNSADFTIRIQPKLEIKLI